MAADVEHKPPKNYPLRGAIYFMIGHVFLAILITLWGYQTSIFEYHSVDKLFYIIELPGAEFTSLIGQAPPIAGQAESTGGTTPYLITFIINTICYGLIGFGVGYLFKRYNLIEETENVFLTEEEQQRNELEEKAEKTGLS